MGVGSNLKKILKEKNITIKELSESTGISINTLYSITKRDSSNIRFDIIQKIMEILDIELLELLGEPSGDKGSRILDTEDMIFLKSNREEIEKNEISRKKHKYINILTEKIRNMISSLAVHSIDKKLYSYGVDFYDLFHEYILNSLRISIERCGNVIDEIDTYLKDDGKIDENKVSDYLYKGQKPDTHKNTD